VLRIILLSFILSFAIIFAGCQSQSVVASDVVDENDLQCLAMNIYHEARNQQIIGQIAVSNVVLNRVKDERYPNTICDVVRDAKLKSNGYPKINQCQFSWYCDGKPDTPLDIMRWEDSKSLARLILNNKKLFDVTNGATHYHATYVDPYWNKSMKETVRIGQHIFYK
jgi:N-acetylmuramoyl-L-alanine amidase